MTSVRVPLTCWNETSTFCALNTESKGFGPYSLRQDTFCPRESLMKIRQSVFNIGLTRFAHHIRNYFLMAQLPRGA